MKSQEAATLRPSSLAKRHAILAAAEQAFLAARYDSVTMDEIADMAQVSKQTVYTHFGTKDQLFVELVTAMTKGAGDEVSAGSAVPASREHVREALEELLGHQLAVVMTPRLLRLRRLVISEVPRFPDLARAVYDQGPRRAVAALEALLGELDARGWVQVPNPAVAAEQLNWLVMGAPTNAAMYLGDDVAPSPAEQELHVRRAVGAFLAAYDGAL
ncbi:TetR/AcrR family transcriptional regulator [Nocardioides sp.]|uniref:TetR/AcrR family transcriptional regulator n=1 Tax=Nocardioides sp. TaxID=35761 RepID=UPI002B273A9C|nr:TetR/AcrR family transcriptional regulator [Nocardioides sp.]